MPQTMSSDASSLCPVCLADRGFRAATPRNLWERWVLPLAGRRPGRCNACGARLSRPAGDLRARSAAVASASATPAGSRELVDLTRHRKVVASEDYDRLIGELRRTEQEMDRNEADTGG